MMKSLISKIKSSPLFQDSFWALFGSALGKGLSLIAGIAIARFLGKEAYGEYGIIKNTLLMIAIFSSFGLGYTATKFVAENKQDNAKTYLIHKISSRITFVTSTIIAFLVFVFAENITIWIDAPDLNSILRWSAVAIIFNAVNTTQTGELSGFNAYRQIAWNNLWVGIFVFVASIVLTYFWNLEGAVIALACSYVLNCVLNRITLNKYLKEHKVSHTEDSKCLRNEIIKFSLPVALQESLYSITHWLNVVVLIKLSGYGQLGLSSAANQWSAVMLFIPGALRNVALSHLSQTNKDHKENNIILKRLLTINIFSTFIPFVIISLLSKWICSWYGSDFTGLQAVLSIGAFTAVVNSMSNVFTQEFMAMSKNWYLFLSRFLRDCCILLTLYIVLSHKYQDYGALVGAIVTLCYQSIYLLLLLLQYRAIKNGK